MEFARASELVRRKEMSDYSSNPLMLPSEFFLNLIPVFEKKLQQYALKIEEIDQLLKPMEQQQQQSTAQSI